MDLCMEPEPQAVSEGQCKDGLVPRCPVTVLKHALHSLPNTNTEYMIRKVACQLAESYAEQVTRNIRHFFKGCFWQDLKLTLSFLKCHNFPGVLETS